MRTGNGGVVMTTWGRARGPFAMQEPSLLADITHAACIEFLSRAKAVAGQGERQSYPKVGPLVTRHYLGVYTGLVVGAGEASDAAGDPCLLRAHHH